MTRTCLGLGRLLEDNTYLAVSAVHEFQLSHPQPNCVETSCSNTYIPMPYAIQSIFTSVSVVFLSWKTGATMSTLDPRRKRMLRTRLGNRGCGLIHSSGIVSDCANSPFGFAAGIVNEPTPSNGKAFCEDKQTEAQTNSTMSH